MGPFPTHIFISFSALAKSPSSAHLFLQGCCVHDHRLPGRGDDDHPGLRQVRVVPRPLQKQHGGPSIEKYISEILKKKKLGRRTQLAQRTF